MHRTIIIYLCLQAALCKDIICDNNIIKSGGQICREAEFQMSSKLNWIVKLDCYTFRMLIVIPRVTTKKITKIYTEKEMRRR